MIRNFLIIIGLSTIVSLGFSQLQASYGRDLNGTYLGVSHYKPFHRGPNRAATRLYLHEVQGEGGSYYAVLLEYVNLFKMAPQYVASSKLPAANEVIGYLKEITKKISVYKVVPTKKDGTLTMHPLKVIGNKIVAQKIKNPRKLILQKEGELPHALAGATITCNQEGQPKEIFFPMKKDGKISGIQYSIAKLVYEKVGLDSTWRKDFLPGPYLSAYGRLNDTVLELKKEDSQETMDFVLNPEQANKPKRKREKMFTNAKSAFLEGSFDVLEPADGMFILKPIKAEAATNSILAQRIGLFIDIFDATRVLNQDVVELVFVNTENPEDFLMYYEHPDNGEGR